MADKIDELRRDVGGGEEPVDVDALVASLKEALSAPASPTSPASPASPAPPAPAPPDAAAAQLVDVSVDGADAGAN
jgi:ribosomal protein L12E/L44/L45/RPP1/RPP2